MIIYLDLVFLSNILIDGIILLLTAWTRKLRVKIWRIIVAALIGASYVLFLFMPALSVLYTFYAKVLFSLAMIFTAFGFGGLHHFFKNTGVFYFINFTAAGLIFAANHMLMSSDQVLSGILRSRMGGWNVSFHGGLFLILPLFIFALLLYKTVVRGIRERGGLTRFIADIEVKIEQFSFRCSGLIDTGNQLYDPLTRTPVMVVEASQMKAVLPQSWMSLISDADVERIFTDANLQEGSLKWDSRLRLVPFRGLNRHARMMLALKPDRVNIFCDGKVIETKNVLIGLHGDRLCTDGSYQAIIHPELL